MTVDNEQKNNLTSAEISKLRQSVLNNLTAKPVLPKIEEKKIKVEPPKPVTLPQSKILTTKPVIQAKNLKPERANQPLRKIGLSFSKTILKVICIIIFLIISFQIGLYFFQWQNKSIETITEIIPFPATIVNYHVITYNSWVKQINSQAFYYQYLKKNDPNSQIPEIKVAKTKTLDRMIDQELLKQLAVSYNVDINSSEVNDEMVRMIKSVGGLEFFENELKKTYNWTLYDFQKTIFEPMILKNKLSLFFLNQPENTDKRELAEQIVNQLKEKSETFENLAKEYSNDPSGKIGGDIGSYGLGELAQNIQEEIFKLKPEQTTGVIETTKGFSIFKVDSFEYNEKGIPNKAKIKVILIATKDIDQIIAEYKQKARIIKLINI